MKKEMVIYISDITIKSITGILDFIDPFNFLCQMEDAVYDMLSLV